MAKKYRLKDTAQTGKGRVTPFEGKLYDLEAKKDYEKTVPATKGTAEYKVKVHAPTQNVLKSLLTDAKYGKWDKVIEEYESSGSSNND